MEKNVKEQLYDEKFRAQLEQGMAFPGDYPFKFIVKADSDASDRIRSVFDGANARISATLSAKGNYVSMTIVMSVSSPQEIIDKYNAVADIPNVIKL